MIYLNQGLRRTVCALASILLAIGWGLYGLLDGGRTFLAVMFVLSVLTGALYIVVRPRQEPGAGRTAA